MPFRTVYCKNLISEEQATDCYNYLKDNIEWAEGIRSKNGPTRLASPLSWSQLEDHPKLKEIVYGSLISFSSENPNTFRLDKYGIYGIYLNYYKNGEMYTPNHSHPKTVQFIISLGGERILNVGKKEFSMKNGDVIAFGSSIHGVPKSSSTEGRISIALFGHLSD